MAERSRVGNTHTVSPRVAVGIGINSDQRELGLIDRGASLLLQFSLASRFDGFTNIDEAPRKGIATSERFVLSTNQQYTASGIKNHAITHQCRRFFGKCHS